MIINFSVQNFGCIKDKVTLSFEATKSDDLEDYYIVEPKKGLRLLKLGLIYGPNASGKTTILKAFQFLYLIVLYPLEKKTDSFDFQPFIFDENTPKENTLLRLEFIQNEVKYLYEVELNQRAIVKEKLYFYRPNKALVYKRKTDSEKRLTKLKFGSKLKISKNNRSILEGNTLWNNTVLGGYLKTNFQSDELQNVSDWFSTYLITFTDQQTVLKHIVTLNLKENDSVKKGFLDILNKADFNVVDVLFKNMNTNKEISTNDLDPVLKYYPNEYQNIFDRVLRMENTQILFKHKIINENSEKNYILPYENQSEGTKKYYEYSGLLGMLINASVRIFIDELEASLHPDLLEHFLLTFLVNSKKSQLIATTHYRELLIKKDIFRNDAIWLTEKKPDGSTDLFSLADFDSSVIRDTTSIYNAYKVGKLGAIPNLSDYYLETENG